MSVYPRPPTEGRLLHRMTLAAKGDHQQTIIYLNMSRGNAFIPFCCQIAHLFVVLWQRIQQMTQEVFIFLVILQ